ncbi:MAG: hypothetical protein AVO35_07850 [Candidatus Aegiribacteria sp. MLS_C]|nr:MAG: hypothetical protein AVO35_07850 [Candidatus Aegiribacteria sp. MLS_C]
MDSGGNLPAVRLLGVGVSPEEETGIRGADDPEGSGPQSSSRILGTISRRRLRRGLALFCSITIVSLAALFVLTRSEGILEAFQHYDTAWFGFTVFLMLLDVVLGSYRNHVFMKRLDPSVEFMTSVRANLANTFVGAITPSQGGGGPAQFYVYHRKGGSIGQAVFVAAFNYLSTIVVFICGAAVSYAVLSERLGSGFTGVVLISFIVFSVEFLLLVVAFSRPQLFISLMSRITGRTKAHFPRLGRMLGRLTDRISLEVETFSDSSRNFFSHNRMMIPLSLVLTLALYLNKYSIAYTILLGMCIRSDFMTVISIQAVLMCILYFSPSPGGSGIAEFSIAALMSVILPESRLVVFSLLQRSFLLYLPMILGAFVIFHEIRVFSRVSDESREGSTGHATSSKVDHP